MVSQTTVIRRQPQLQDVIGHGYSKPVFGVLFHIRRKKKENFWKKTAIVTFSKKNYISLILERNGRI